MAFAFLDRMAVSAKIPQLGTTAAAAPPPDSSLETLAHSTTSFDFASPPVPPDLAGELYGHLAEPTGSTAAEIDAGAEEKKASISNLLDKKSQEVGTHVDDVQAKAETQAGLMSKEQCADMMSGLTDAALPARDDAPQTDAQLPAAPSAQAEPPTRESLDTQLTGELDKEEAVLEDDKAKALADFDDKIAAQKQILDGGVLSASATEPQSQQLLGQSDEAKANLSKQLDNQKADLNQRTGDIMKANQARADAEATQIETAGETDADAIKKGGEAEGDRVLIDADRRGAAALRAAKASADQVLADGKPQAQADKLYTEAAAANGRIVSDGIAAREHDVAQANAQAEQHRAQTKALANQHRLQAALGGNIGKVPTANKSGIASQEDALKSDDIMVDEQRAASRGVMEGDAEEGRVKQRQKAADTIAILEKERQALSDRLDAQIAAQKKSLEARTESMRTQVASADPATLPQLAVKVKVTTGEIDKASQALEASAKAQVAMAAQRIKAQVTQAVAVMAAQGAAAMAKVDADAKQAKLDLEKSYQSASADLASGGDASMATLDAAEDAVREDDSKNAVEVMTALVKAGQTAKLNLTHAADIDIEDLKIEARKVDDRNTELAGKDFAKMQSEADADAKYLTGKLDHSFHFTTKQKDINDLLRKYADDPDKMQMLKDAYKEANPKGKDLDAQMSGLMDDKEIKEARAYERNDVDTANVAILEQGNKERSDKMIEEVKKDPASLERLTDNIEVQTGDEATDLLKKSLSKGELADVSAKVADTEHELKNQEDKRLADVAGALRKEDPDKYEETKRRMTTLASQINAKLSSTIHVGNRYDVTDMMRGLSTEEVAVLKEQYRTGGDYEGGGDLDAAINKDLSGADRKAAKAELSGDSVRSAEALVEEAADGPGTKTDSWQKAMETLKTPEERARFRDEMTKQSGRTYDELNRSENSGYDRDLLGAEGIVDQNQHDAKIATVNYEKSAYGGKINMIEDAICDEVGDMRGETDEQRQRDRKTRRDGDLFTMFSNLGEDQEGMLNAMDSLKVKDKDGHEVIDPEKLRQFKENVEGDTGKTVKEINHDKLTRFAQYAADDYASGDLRSAKTDRMISSSQHLLLTGSDADGMSKAFEGVTDPKERAQMLADMDGRLRMMGYAGGYAEWSKKKLGGDEDKRAMERAETGKTSEALQLKMAGDTVLGFGKDVGKMTDILAKMSPEAVEKFRADFAKENHQDLDQFILGKCTSEGQQRDFQVMLQGNYAAMKPAELEKLAEDDPEKLIQRVKDLHHAGRDGAGHEIGDGITNGIGNFIADQTSNTGQLMDDRLARADAVEKKLKNGETLSKGERQELIDDMRFMSGDKEGFVDAKNKAVDTTAEVVGDATELGVDLATGNNMGGAAAGGLMKIGVKGSLNSARYGVDDLVKDLASTGISAATAHAGNSAAVKGLISNPLVRDAAIGGASGAFSSAVDWKAMRDGGNFVETILQGTESGLLSGGMGSYIGKKTGPMFGQVSESGELEFESKFHAALNGIASASGSNVADVIANDDLTSGVGLLKHFAEGEIRQTVQGVGGKLHDHQENLEHAEAREAAERQGQEEAEKRYEEQHKFEQHHLDGTDPNSDYSQKLEVQTAYQQELERLSAQNKLDSATKDTATEEALERLGKIDRAMQEKAERVDAMVKAGMDPKLAETMATQDPNTGKERSVYELQKQLVAEQHISPEAAHAMAEASVSADRGPPKPELYELDTSVHRPLATQLTPKLENAASAETDPDRKAKLEALATMAQAATSKTDGIVSVKDAREMAARAAELGLPASEVPHASTPEEILAARMTPEELQLYNDSLGKDGQSVQTMAELKELGGTRKVPLHNEDRNIDGTRRQPLSLPQAAAILKASIIQYEGFTEGESLTKVIPDGQVADFLSGKRNAIGGDIGLSRNTEGETAAGKARALGLDYQGSPFVTPDEHGNLQVHEDAAKRIFQIDKKITAQDVEAAKVVMGPDMFEFARIEAKRYQALKDADPTVEIPKLLELDAEGNLKHIGGGVNSADPRIRTDKADPSTGLGYSASQGLRDEHGNMYFRPNCELNIGFKKDTHFSNGDELATIDAKGNRKVIGAFDQETNAFKLADGLSPEEAAEYTKDIVAQQNKPEVQERAKEIVKTEPSLSQEEAVTKAQEDLVDLPAKGFLRDHSGADGDVFAP